MILKQLVEAVDRKEELKIELEQLRQALELGHIDAALRIVHDMEWTISQMQE